MLRFIFLFLCTILLNQQLQYYTEKKRQNSRESFALILLHSSRWYCGSASVIADMQWLWLSYHAQELNLHQFCNYAEYITTLDPHFNVVYRFAALYLMIQKQSVLSLRLLYKGLYSPHNSDDWRIYLYCAYNTYFFEKKYANTVQFLRHACEQPANFAEVLKQDRTAPPHFLARWRKKLENDIA